MSNFIKIENEKLSLKPLFIIKNPTFSQYEGFYKNTKEGLIRGIINKNNLDFFIADAYYFYHEYMLELIMEKYDIQDKFEYWCYKDDGVCVSLENYDNLKLKLNELFKKLEPNRLLFTDYIRKKEELNIYNDYLIIKTQKDADEFLIKYPHIKRAFTVEDLLKTKKYDEKEFSLIVENKYDSDLQLYKNNLS